MGKYSFLTKEQLESSEVLKKIGKKAEITDFSVLLGGDVGSLIYNKGKRYGDYWTQTAFNGSDVYIFNAFGKIQRISKEDRCCGIRPVIPISYIKNNYPDIQVDEEGFIEFGNYPQTAVSAELQAELEQAFSEGKLEKTGNTYTVDSQSIYANQYRTMDSSFKPQVYEEVVYNGKKYIRVKANNTATLGSEDNKLSNGKEYKQGDYIWVEIEPVRWIMDEQLGIFISEKILAAGLQYQEREKVEEISDIGGDRLTEILREKLESSWAFDIDFEGSTIKYFLNEIFSKDLEQGMVKQRNRKNDIEPNDEER